MSKSPKEEISLGFICRNGDPAELKSIPLMLDSAAKWVDEVCCTVTLKNEGDEINAELKGILESFNCKISTFVWTDNFSEARNFNLSQCTKELFFWLDSDDVLVGGEHLPALARKLGTSQALNQIWFNYNYAQDAQDNPVCDLERERLVKRSIHKWQSYIHETCKTKFAQVATFEPKIEVKHNLKDVDLKEKAMRNLNIAIGAYNKQKEAGELDARLVYDLSRSYMTVGMLSEAEERLKEFLKMSPSAHDQYDSFLRLADICKMSGRINQGLDYANKAVLIKWDWPFAYFKLSELYLMKDLHAHVDRADFMLECGKKFTAPKAGVAYNPTDIKLKPMLLKQEILFRQNKPEDSLKIIREGLKEFPQNTALQGYEKRCVDFLNRITAEKGVQVHLDLINDELNLGVVDEKTAIEKKKHLFQSIPECLQDFRPLVMEKNKVFPIDGSNRVVIYCGPMSGESWDSSSEEKGIGGSEEAVINVSRELVKMGWRVDIYAQPKNRGEQEGVNYWHLDEYDNTQEAKVFIAWRMPIFAMQAPKDALVILWAHDRQVMNHYTPEIVDTIDKIFVLSKYHRTDLPDFPDDKFYITRNGIKPEHFEQTIDFQGQPIKRDINEYIYASSPDRGLEVILEAWPEIRRINPEAKLRIFYGFNVNFDRVDEHRYDRWKAKERITQKMLDLKDQGLIYHGRVGHEVLAQYFLKCGFWLYPTTFTEISCITAMKAQAAGCIPICNDFAALAETVQHGFISKGTMDKPEILDDWLRNVKKSYEIARDKPEEDQAFRKEMSDWAKKAYSWNNLAEDWSNRFKEWSNNG